mmetsp:Transcript_60242/g.160285  ORF Transcript_60242/g.160285 Transcript_60242/m.160285 type:complete len:225 (+) Transcript_60242:359-1033(+)
MGASMTARVIRHDGMNVVEDEWGGGWGRCDRSAQAEPTPPHPRRRRSHGARAAAAGQSWMSILLRGEAWSSSAARSSGSEGSGAQKKKEGIRPGAVRTRGSQSRVYAPAVAPHPSHPPQLAVAEVVLQKLPDPCWKVTGWHRAVTVGHTRKQSATWSRTQANTILVKLPESCWRPSRSATGGHSAVTVGHSCGNGESGRWTERWKDRSTDRRTNIQIERLGGGQ